MKSIIRIWLFVFLFSGSTACTGQTTTITKGQADLVGGGCEGCDLMFVGRPGRLSPIDTSNAWGEGGQPLLVTGTVVGLDGKTPAAGVTLYYYHTNREGSYVHKPTVARSMAPNPLGQTHGYIRGWIKTDADGKYAIYTVKPGTYPTRDEPAHIHLIVKEPGNINEYYIDDLVFDDDDLLTTAKRNRLTNRGGSGILRVLESGTIQIAEHNIVLGLNIPNYPVQQTASLSSGLSIGEDSPSFIPYHAWGPDKGTRTCPVCKYGRYQGIVYFVGNNPDWSDINQWLRFLESESIKRSTYLKAYFVYGNSKGYSQAKRQAELEAIGSALSLKNVALTFVPSLTDVDSEVHLNRINPAADNTFVLYKHRTIVGKFVNLNASPAHFSLISSALDSTRGDYFHLKEPKHE